MSEIEVNHEVSASAACSFEEGDEAVDVLTGEGGKHQPWCLGDARGDPLDQFGFRLRPVARGLLAGIVA